MCDHFEWVKKINLPEWPLLERVNGLLPGWLYPRGCTGISVGSCSVCDVSTFMGDWLEPPQAGKNSAHSDCPTIPNTTRKGGHSEVNVGAGISQ